MDFGVWSNFLTGKTTGRASSHSCAFRFAEAESRMDSARDNFFDAVTITTPGDFDDDDDDDVEGEDDDDALRIARRLRFADRDFPSVLVTLGVMNAVSWAPFFVLLLAEPLLARCSVMSWASSEAARFISFGGFVIER